MFGVQNHHCRVVYLRYSLMTLLNEDADDASSVGSDGSNVAPGLVFDDEEDFFAHKGDDVSAVEEQDCGSVCLSDCVCAAGSGVVILNYIARYVFNSVVHMLHGRASSCKSPEPCVVMTGESNLINGFRVGLAACCSKR